MVAALFVRADSIYKTIEGVDTWDVVRDARKYAGPHPVICHPPCRCWGTLRAFAKGDDEEKNLAVLAVEFLRRWGGVLEHPYRSTLWTACGLPRPGQGMDRYGRFAIDLDQHWFGHRAQKRTWVLISGCQITQLPPLPFAIGQAPRVITNVHGLRKGDPRYRKEVTKREREATPPAFAAWLVAVAKLCRPKS